MKLVETEISAELLFTLRNLFDSFESVQPKLIANKKSIDYRSVAVFEEIIVSQLFREYEDKHSAFEENDLAIQDVQKMVEAAGKKISLRKSELIQTKRAVVSLLPVTAKLIDLLFGRLPGGLAKLLSESLSNLLDVNRRLVIY